MLTARAIQTLLKAKGFDPGEIDGIPGRRTLAAIRKFQAANDLVVDGIVGSKTARALRGELGRQPEAVPPWFDVAASYLGLRETPGPRTTVAIADWLKRLNAPFADDETAWCGTAMGAWIATALPNEPLPPAPWGSRNWLAFGRALSTPALGAVLVFWRSSPDSWQGHVGLYAGERADAYLVRGGNQHDSVCDTWISRHRLRAGGIRWPSTYPVLTSGRVPLRDDGSPLSTNEA